MQEMALRQVPAHADSFNLDVLLDYIPQHKKTSDAFQQWSRQTTHIMLQCFSDVLHQPMEEDAIEEKSTPFFQFPSILSVNQQLGHS